MFQLMLKEVVNFFIFLLLSAYDNFARITKKSGISAPNFVSADQKTDASKASGTAGRQIAATAFLAGLTRAFTFQCLQTNAKLLLLTRQSDFEFFIFLQSETLLSIHFLCEEQSLRHCFWHRMLLGAEELWLLFSLCQEPQSLSGHKIPSSTCCVS